LPQQGWRTEYLSVVALLLANIGLFIDGAVQLSRNIAIRNSETLIQPIENYQKSGHYPNFTTSSSL
jgi:hypothetical protein